MNASQKNKSKPGIVYLIGAGPGDPGLLTLRGLECLRLADTVVFDRLACQRLLRYAPQAEWIDVGKYPNSHPTPQAEINRILIEKASAGNVVARLKGGDPFVFGRGGEEALALVEAGLRFEVVPGVTSAIAVPAYAGIPVTQRGMARSFVVVTGHHSAEAPIDCFAPCADTRVFLMGVERLPEIVAGLLESGLSPQTPAAVVARGTTPYQHVVFGCLEDIVSKADGIKPPAITVVGETARLSQQLAWFDQASIRPLLGLRIVNTRPQESDRLDEFSEALLHLGADVFELPAIRLAAVSDPTELDASISRLAHGAATAPAYDWVLFTSANAVRFFVDRLWQTGYDGRILAGTRLGAIGSATAAILAEYHLKADLIPPQATGRSLAQALGEAANGARVLLPRSAIALPDLANELTRLGARVDSAIAYEPMPAEADPETLQMALDGKVDLTAFFSPSAVSGLRGQIVQASGETRADQVLAALPAACIGPTTAAAARSAGMQVVVMPEQYTAESLVEAITAWRSR